MVQLQVGSNYIRNGVPKVTTNMRRSLRKETRQLFSPKATDFGRPEGARSCPPYSSIGSPVVALTSPAHLTRSPLTRSPLILPLLSSHHLNSALPNILYSPHLFLSSSTHLTYPHLTKPHLNFPYFTLQHLTLLLPSYHPILTLPLP